MIGLLLPLAAAAEPSPSEPPPAEPPSAPEAPIPLDAGAEPLPSALDALDQAHAERQGEVTLDQVVADWVPKDRQRLRGQLFVRPIAGVVVLPDEGGSARLGVAAGHRAWTLKPGPLAFATEERVVATGLLGAGLGGSLAGSALLGPWVGPVGLRVGPTARLDASRWSDDAVLSGAGAVGIAGEVTLAAGPVSVTAGVEPAWLVSGDRRPARDALILGLGDETTWRAGLGWAGRPIQWGIDLEARDTVVGTLWTGGLSFQLRFL